MKYLTGLLLQEHLDVIARRACKRGLTDLAHDAKFVNSFRSYLTDPTTGLGVAITALAAGSKFLPNTILAFWRCVSPNDTAVAEVWKQECLTNQKTQPHLDTLAGWIDAMLNNWIALTDPATWLGFPDAHVAVLNALRAEDQISSKVLFSFLFLFFFFFFFFFFFRNVSTL